MTRRLLLLTNEYPYQAGDVGFVCQEIDALAARFDDVVVFCMGRDDTLPMVDMPSNVRLGGNFFTSQPEDAPRNLLRPWAIRAFLRAAWCELRAGRLFARPRLFVLGSKVGITQANRRALRQAMTSDTTVYAFWGMGSGLALPWIRGARAKVLRVHRYDLYEERAETKYLPFRRFLYSQADLILPISTDGVEYLASKRGWNIDAAKVRLSRLGAVGPEDFVRPQRDDRYTVVSCSSVIPVKRVEVIAASIAALPAAGIDRPVRWVHFGDGPELDSIRASAVFPQGVTAEFRGATAHDMILDFYRNERVDAFINASASEGVPVSIMEAIAHDIPVVATAVGGTPEIVGAELRTGELVPETATAADIAQTLACVLRAEDGHYRPRELWQREYDVAHTSAWAADLVATASDRAAR